MQKRDNARGAKGPHWKHGCCKREGEPLGGNPIKEEWEHIEALKKWNKATIELHVRPEMDTAQRELVLSRWHRRQLRGLLPPLLEKSRAALGVRVSECRIKKMKWGTPTSAPAASGQSGNS